MQINILSYSMNTENVSYISQCKFIIQAVHQPVLATYVVTFQTSENDLHYN